MALPVLRPITRGRPFKRLSKPVPLRGGGIVYLPPGEYTSGTLSLRSHVRFHIEGGATLYASQNPEDFNTKPRPDKAALFFGENLVNVSLEGRGIVNGQAEYEWRVDDAVCRDVAGSRSPNIRNLRLAQI